MKRIQVLSNFIKSCYYQTIWEDFNSDEEVWRDYFSKINKEELEMYKELVLSIVNEAKSSDLLNELLNNLENTMIGISFDSTNEIYEWAKRLNTFLKSL